MSCCLCVPQIKLNVDYIPPSQSEKYSKEAVGKDLLALVPPGKTPQQFQQNIAAKFKNVIPPSVSCPLSLRRGRLDLVLVATHVVTCLLKVYTLNGCRCDMYV